MVTSSSGAIRFPAIVIASRVKASRILMASDSEIECVVSIGAPGEAQPAGFLRVPKRLRLEFSDVIADCGAEIAPCRADVEKIVAFAPVIEGCEGTTLIHCEAGISRSSAAALAVLAKIAGPGRETDVVAELFRIHPAAYPNELMVRLADEILEVEGKLMAALQQALRRRE